MRSLLLPHDGLHRVGSLSRHRRQPAAPTIRRWGTATAGHDGAPLAKGTVPAIVAMGLAIFVIANDVTAMSVALPGIETDLNADIATVQWVVSAYALVFGVLIVTGGKFADMFGRRRILMVGAAFFAGFSLVGGLAPNAPVLLAARAMQGIGGALIWPAALGLLYPILPDDRADLAGGLVIGIAGIGNAAGPLLGGMLTQSLSWRWILLLNIPITAIDLHRDHEGRPEGRAHPSAAGSTGSGIATITIGLFVLLIVLTEGPDIGWTNPVSIATVRLSPVMLMGFVVQRAADGQGRPHHARGDTPNRSFRNVPASRIMLMSAAVLRLPAVPAAVPAEDPRLRPAQGRRRAAAADGGVRHGVVPRRPDRAAHRAAGGGHDHRAPRA